MFRRQRGFVRSDIWYIHVNGGESFQMIFFDIINSLFKWCFRFKFVHSILILVLSCSYLLSDDAETLEICFSCTRSFDGILTYISLITSVFSERHGVSELKEASSSSIFFDSWYCCFMKSIKSSSVYSKFWSDISKVAHSLVSKQ